MTHAATYAPPTMPATRGVRRWRTGWLVWPPASLLGFFGFSLLLTGMFDGGETAPARAAIGLGGAALLTIAGRLVLAGVRLDGARVRVRGVWRTRSLARGEVAGVAAESSVGGRWLTPSVVARDGRLLRARWAARPAGGSGVEPLFAELATSLASASATEDAGTVLARRGLHPAGNVYTTSVWQPPPTWPSAPVGFRPTPRWMAPPGWPPAPDGWTFWRRLDVPVITVTEFGPEADEPAILTAPEYLDKQFRLDRQVARDLVVNRWGFGEVGKAFGWLALLVVVGGGLAYVAGGTVGGFVAESGIGIAVVLAARGVVVRAGGWRAAFGWSLPRRGEAGVTVRWAAWSFVAQAVAAIVLGALLPDARSDPATNTDYLHQLGVWELVIEVPTIVLVAPMVEELFFRGLVLRAAMRRFSFWPSAVLTSTLFGLGHMAAADSGVDAIQLAVTAAVFGAIQCMLVRRVGRLGPAIGVHAIHNAVAVIATLA